MFYANLSPFYNKKILTMKKGKEEKGRKGKRRRRREGGGKKEKERERGAEILQNIDGRKPFVFYQIKHWEVQKIFKLSSNIISLKS